MALKRRGAKLYAVLNQDSHASCFPHIFRMRALKICHWVGFPLMIAGITILWSSSEGQYIQVLRSAMSLVQSPQSAGAQFDPFTERSTFRQFRHQCYSLPDFSEFCLYENVCWADDQLLIPTAADNRSSDTLKSFDDTVDNYMNFPLPGAGEPTELRKAILPRRSFLNPRFTYIDASVFDKARRHEKFAFLTGFDSTNENLFHFAQSTLLYHVLSQMNGTFLGRAAVDGGPWGLPSLSAAVLLRPSPATAQWIARFAKFLFGPGTPLIWSEEAKDYTEESPLCFDRLMVSGTIIHLTLGVRDAEALRDRIGRDLGLPRPLGRPRPPRHIVVERRRSRSWTNHDEIMHVVHETGVPYEETSLEALTFEEQVQVLGGAGVFVSAHGAGMTNVLWMPTGGVVVEAFPSKVWQYNLYGEIARNAGLFHRSVHGNVSGEAYGEAGRTPVDCLGHMSCNVGLKQDFYIRPDDFRTALHSALNLAGIMIEARR